MAEKQITKKQHYVPQFYLKRFVNEDGKLEILDCEKRLLVKPRTPKSVCREDFYYGVNNNEDDISQMLEDIFQELETNIANEYEGVAKKFTDFSEISVSDKYVVATFMSMLWLRGPYMRKQTQKMDEKMIKMISERHFQSENVLDELDEITHDDGQKLTKKEKRDTVDFVLSGEYSVKTNNSSHLTLIAEMEGFRNLLFHKEWTVYISKSSKKFITSDNPVLELFPDWTGKFFYGPSFLQRTHCLAMTPDIFIVASNPRHDIGNKVKRKTLFDNFEHNQKILELNFDHPRFSHAYAYANKSDFLQDIVDSANLYDRQHMAKYIDK